MIFLELIILQRFTRYVGLLLKKVNFALDLAMKAQRRSRGIVPLFL